MFEGTLGIIPYGISRRIRGEGSTFPRAILGGISEELPEVIARRVSEEVFEEIPEGNSGGISEEESLRNSSL